MSNTTENAWHRLTMASEDYLETIYRIMQEENAFDGIRSKDVADQLEVSKASVNKASKKTAMLSRIVMVAFN